MPSCPRCGWTGATEERCDACSAVFDRPAPTGGRIAGPHGAHIHDDGGSVLSPPSDSDGRHPNPRPGRPITRPPVREPTPAPAPAGFPVRPAQSSGFLSSALVAVSIVVGMFVYWHVTHEPPLDEPEPQVPGIGDSTRAAEWMRIALEAALEDAERLAVLPATPATFESARRGLLERTVVLRTRLSAGRVGGEDQSRFAVALEVLETFLPGLHAPGGDNLRGGEGNDPLPFRKARAALRPVRVPPPASPPSAGEPR